ncbi:MAG: hypothetical protein Q8S09_10220 [Hyphomonas sp.]|nr:hypothetical protein [Hyphomonas sp.]
MILLTLTTCISLEGTGASEPMTEMRFEEDDPIVPTKITHKSEQIWDGSSLEQSYNYLVYEFETEQHRYVARAYLGEIETVAIYGPFDRASADLVEVDGVEIDQRVVAYLRRRYTEITLLGKEGYEPIELSRGHRLAE